MVWPPAYVRPREYRTPGLPDVAQHPPDTRRVSMQRSRGGSSRARSYAHGAPAVPSATTGGTPARGADEEVDEERERSATRLPNSAEVSPGKFSTNLRCF